MSNIVLLLAVAAAALAATPSDPLGAGLTADLSADPRVSALRAEEQAAIVAGNEALVRVIEEKLQAIYTEGRPAVSIPVERVGDVPRTPPGDAPDVVIVQSPGKFAAIAADYQMDGTMWAAASFRSDSSCRIYKSTDHGNSWQFFDGFAFASRALLTRLQLVVGQGESAKVCLFALHPDQSGDLVCVRWSMDGTVMAAYGVLAGADTITDFAACRDYSGSDYWLYAVAHNGLNPSNYPPSFLCRSANYGRNWAAIDTLANCVRPHIAAGAGSCIYLSSVGNQNQWPGLLVIGLSLGWGGNGTWASCSQRPDQEVIYDCAISPAFTLPAASATFWVAYSHFNTGANVYQVLSLASSDTGHTFIGPTTVCARNSAYIDLKNYTSIGNTYMNLVYNLTDRVYHHWVNASTPDRWSDSVRINQSNYTTYGIDVGPQLAYSPGGGSGGGAVFVNSDSTRVLWNAPWLTGLVESPGIQSGAGLRILPNPARAGHSVRLVASWMDTGPAELQLFDALGREVLARPFDTRHSTFDIPALASGVYFARLSTGRGERTSQLILR